MAFSFPTSNATSCALVNDTDASRCYGRGVCELDESVGYPICHCDLKLDPLTYCRDTFYHAYDGVDLILPIIFLPLSLLLLFFFAFELLLDIKRFGLHALKQPLTLAKLSMAFYLVCSCAALSLWFFESGLKTVFSQNYQITLRVLIVFAGGVSGVAYTLCLIAWLDIVMKAKQLNIRRKSMVIVRWVVLIAFLTLYPLSVIMSTITSFGIALFLVPISGMLAAIVTILEMGFSFYYITRISYWRRSLDSSEVSYILRKVFRKNKIIFCVNLCLIVQIFLAAVGPIVFDLTLPYPYLVRSFLFQFATYCVLVGVFVFAENYFTRGKGLSAYRRGLKGEFARSKTSTTRSSTKGKQSHSTTSSTTTLASNEVLHSAIPVETNSESESLMQSPGPSLSESEPSSISIPDTETNLSSISVAKTYSRSE